MPNQDAHDYLDIGKFETYELGIGDTLSTCSCCGNTLSSDPETSIIHRFYLGPSGWNHCIKCYRIRTRQPEWISPELAALIYNEEQFYEELLNA